MKPNPIPALLLLLAATQANSARGQAPSEALLKSYMMPNLTLRVAFAQPGKISRLDVRETQAVQAGDLLANLEDRSLLASLRIAETKAEDDSEVHAAQSSANRLQQRLQSLEELVETGGASPDEIKRVQTELQVAQAKLESARVAGFTRRLEVQRLQAELELRQLKSPIDGHIKRIHKRLGEYVGANEPMVMELVQLDPLKARFFVPRARAMDLTPQQSVRLKLPQLSQSIAGNVQSISPIVEPVSDTVEIYVEIPNPHHQFRSGLVAELILPADSSHQGASQ